VIYFVVLSMPDYVTSTGKMNCEQWIVGDREGSVRRLILRHCKRICLERLKKNNKISMKLASVGSGHVGATTA
jgi:hypothetical protein